VQARRKRQRLQQIRLAGAALADLHVRAAKLNFDFAQ
jgi:hypothetical protein